AAFAAARPALVDRAGGDLLRSSLRDTAPALTAFDVLVLARALAPLLYAAGWHVRNTSIGLAWLGCVESQRWPTRGGRELKAGRRSAPRMRYSLHCIPSCQRGGRRCRRGDSSIPRDRDERRARGGQLRDGPARRGW